MAAATCRPVDLPPSLPLCAHSAGVRSFAMAPLGTLWAFPSPPDTCQAPGMQRHGERHCGFHFRLWQKLVPEHFSQQGHKHWVRQKPSSEGTGEQPRLPVPGEGRSPPREGKEPHSCRFSARGVCWLIRGPRRQAESCSSLCWVGQAVSQGWAIRQKNKTKQNEVEFRTTKSARIQGTKNLEQREPQRRESSFCASVFLKAFASI